DYRCLAWRSAYRAYLQRHRAFLERTRFEVESTKRSKKRGGRPSIKPPSRQIALRCVYCDAETSLGRLDAVATAAPSPAASHVAPSSSSVTTVVAAPAPDQQQQQQQQLHRRQLNPLMTTSVSAGVSCPSCGRHLPR